MVRTLQHQGQELLHDRIARDLLHLLQLRAGCGVRGQRGPAWDLREGAAGRERSEQAQERDRRGGARLGDDAGRVRVVVEGDRPHGAAVALGIALVALAELALCARVGDALGRVALDGGVCGEVGYAEEGDEVTDGDRVEAGDVGDEAEHADSRLTWDYVLAHGTRSGRVYLPRDS